MNENVKIKNTWDESVKTFWMEGLTTPDGKREITQATRTTDNTTGVVSWAWRGYELRKDGKRRSNAGLTSANFYFDEEVETILIAEVVVAQAVRTTE
jgi:hypothetical protein